MDRDKNVELKRVKAQSRTDDSCATQMRCLGASCIEQAVSRPSLEARGCIGRCLVEATFQQRQDTWTVLSRHSLTFITTAHSDKVRPYEPRRTV
jgi:hypothetical protein